LVGLSLLMAACSSTRGRVGVAAEIPSASGATQKGLASWYGAEFANLPTASGEIFQPGIVSAAHRTLPLGTVVDVTNERNGKTIRVRINDRGPFVAGRILDLSKAAAAEIGSVVDGVVPVMLAVVSLGDNHRVRTVRGRDAESSRPGTSWVVQAGAFGNEANAQKLRDRLAERYPAPFLEDFQGLKRVKFGPYASREAAEAAKDSLGDIGLAGIVVPLP
jgi:rare lipoprotein A